MRDYSPFMLNAALTFHLTIYASPISKDLLSNLYVDNVLLGCSTEKAALLYFSGAGFNLWSWSSNCTQLQALASEQQVSEPTNPVKVLGVYWNAKSDQLFLSPCIATTTWPNTTKREILRWSSGIFDPLGFISPVTIRAKLFLQQLWEEHVNWDAPLNTKVSTEWHTIAASITDAMTFSLPRKYTALIPQPESTTTTLSRVYIRKSQGLRSSCLHTTKQSLCFICDVEVQGCPTEANHTAQVGAYGSSTCNKVE